VRLSHPHFPNTGHTLFTLVSSSSTRAVSIEMRRAAGFVCGWIWLGLSVACSLTREDFEPHEVSALGGAANGAAGASATNNPPSNCSGAGCCTTALDCSGAQLCVNGFCADACAAGEDLSTCEVPLCSGPGCPAGSCTDGVQNGREPAADCGESCPSPCEAGSLCNGNADCRSLRCEEARCVEASCSDGIQNGSESAVDCGASCPQVCPVGAGCNTDQDCASGAFCAPGTRVCTDGSCQDGAQTGDEVLADCGGGDCPGCPPGSPCLDPSDCDSRVCNGGLCGVASCSDGLSSGDESGVDCGGLNPECARCDDGAGCLLGADCLSGACEAGSCVSCADDAQNGSETDTDCGGGNTDCARCGTGASCVIDDDCASQDCNAGQCLAASCTDDLQNGSETDTDCGGPNVCPRCAAGGDCVSGADCASQLCANGTCSPCGDGVANGSETDTDCGGADPSCGRCVAGDTCQVDTDCGSGACEGGRCCGGDQADCTRCAARLSQNLSCDFPSFGVDSTGIINCNAFLTCLADSDERCPTRNTPGCSGDNQASDACPHNDYGGNAGTGITRANQVLVNAGCQL
jgi:hypothetical protein